MMSGSIYGAFYPSLKRVEQDLLTRIRAYNEQEIALHGHPIFVHLLSRIKTEESMTEKCLRRGLSPEPLSALTQIYDAVGIRIITGFIDDIYVNVSHIRQLDGVAVTEEKDYIRVAKPNGYRSYHMILQVEEPFADVAGKLPGAFFCEVQLRTIAMDSWASLEHEMKYKQNIHNEKLITSELKRCADEMASCDISMQTIRDLIRKDEA